MMFMKSERYFKRNLIKKNMEMYLFPIIIMFSLTFIMGFYYEPNIYVKLNDITVELGEELPEEITTYDNKSLITDNTNNLSIESNVSLDYEGHTNKVGKYSYYLVYNDENYKYTRPTNIKATLEVVDTVAPIIKLKENVKVKYNSEFSPADVAECYDLSECIMYVDEDIDTTKSGEYEITVIATDEGNNKTVAKSKITVLEKPKPVYTYYAYNGNLTSMNNHNNELNAKLSDEEKANLRNTIVNFAKQFVGNPYVMGGTSLTNGADCSGFTMSVFANFGYRLPRGSVDQAYIGIQVNSNELLPGDLVAYFGHVGIYAGNGMMVHASTPEGGIKYAPVYDGYRVYRRIIF